MKSNAKRKIFINNMITYGMVVAAYIIMQVLVGTGHISSLMKGLLVPFCIYVIMAVSLNLTVGILGELSLGHAGFMCVGAFAGALFSKCMKGEMCIRDRFGGMPAKEAVLELMLRDKRIENSDLEWAEE